MDSKTKRAVRIETSGPGCYDSVGNKVRVFLAPDDRLGFGIADYCELGVAGLGLLLLLLSRARARLSWKWAEKTPWCMALLFVLPIVLRLALLPRCPVPVPSGADDFGYILLADTLRHLRFANPPHAHPEFFEQIFVLQRPAYASMFNLGQGFVLAFGWVLFGHPWAGVLVSSGALCALCYWMLRAWTTPGRALTGGLLCVLLAGPLSYWTNSYWGGAVSACAGCLVFGALPRLVNSGRKRDAIVLGLGLAIQLLTRPYEFLPLLACAVLFLIGALPKWKRLALVALPLLASAVLTLCQNKQITGGWTTLPYSLYRYDYGVPATFTFQPNPVPHMPLNAEKELDYRAESAIHGDGVETLHAYLERLFFRARFYRFFLFAPLYLAVAWSLFGIRTWRQAWVPTTILIFALGSNFYPFFYPHYIAAVFCLFLLVSVAGLAKLKRAGEFMLFLCVAHFLFWFSLHAFGNAKLLSRIGSFETWDFINSGDPQGRIAVNRTLERAPGKHLVFVHYSPGHMFQEWIHNDAEIDAGKTVWVHDIGPEEDDQLRAYYPDHKAWLLEPDAQPPRLIPYPSPKGPFLDVQSSGQRWFPTTR